MVDVCTMWRGGLLVLLPILAAVSVRAEALSPDARLEAIARDPKLLQLWTRMAALSQPTPSSQEGAPVGADAAGKTAVLSSLMETRASAAAQEPVQQADASQQQQAQDSNEDVDAKLDSLFSEVQQLQADAVPTPAAPAASSGATADQPDIATVMAQRDQALDLLQRLHARSARKASAASFRSLNPGPAPVVVAPSAQPQQQQGEEPLAETAVAAASPDAAQAMLVHTRIQTVAYPNNVEPPTVEVAVVPRESRSKSSGCGTSAVVVEASVAGSDCEAQEAVAVAAEPDPVHDIIDANRAGCDRASGCQAGDPWRTPEWLERGSLSPTEAHITKVQQPRPLVRHSARDAFIVPLHYPTATTTTTTTTTPAPAQQATTQTTAAPAPTTTTSAPTTTTTATTTTPTTTTTAAPAHRFSSNSQKEVVELKQRLQDARDVVVKAMQMVEAKGKNTKADRAQAELQLLQKESDTIQAISRATEHVNTAAKEADAAVRALVEQIQAKAQQLSAEAASTAAKSNSASPRFATVASTADIMAAIQQATAPIAAVAASAAAVNDLTAAAAASPSQAKSDAETQHLRQQVSRTYQDAVTAINFAKRIQAEKDAQLQLVQETAQKQVLEAQLRAAVAQRKAAEAVSRAEMLSRQLMADSIKTHAAQQTAKSADAAAAAAARPVNAAPAATPVAAAVQAAEQQTAVAATPTAASAAPAASTTALAKTVHTELEQLVPKAAAAVQAPPAAAGATITPEEKARQLLTLSRQLAELAALTLEQRPPPQPVK